MYTSKTIQNNNNSPLHFLRDYIGKLEKYGEEQEAYHGKKADLIERLERLYNVKLGRYVRHLCGEIILFFPRKRGLTGLGWGKSLWGGTYVEVGNSHVGLAYLIPSVDMEPAPSACNYLFQALGFAQRNGVYHRVNAKPLYIYYQGTLYIADSAKHNRLWLSKV